MLPKKKKLTLSEFLEIYETELMNNLYTIRIQGTLTFEQNLLYSKLINGKTLVEKINQILGGERKDDTLENSSNFLILKSELNTFEDLHQMRLKDYENSHKIY